MTTEKNKEDQVTFESCPNEPECPWFQVPRDFARNPNISLECKGFLTYLMSHTGKFKISMPWVMKTQRIKKHTLYKIVDEAIENGFLRRESYLDKGRKRFRYFVSPSGRFKEMFQSSDFQDAEFQDPEIQDSKLEQVPPEPKLDQSPKGEREKKASKRPPPAPPISLFFYKSVKMDSKDYDALCNEFTKGVVVDKMNGLDTYGKTHPKKFKQYGDHAVVIREWILKDRALTQNLPKAHLNDVRLIKNIQELCPPSVLKQIYCGADYVHFKQFGDHGIVKVGDPSFRSEVEANLRSMGLYPGDIRRIMDA